ncbi:MAG: hypothetical protein LBS50_10720 [Prevotellaceae bacterium]|nr:hypothetical protein [Prevotellaceae bacterium]
MAIKFNSYGVDVKGAYLPCTALRYAAFVQGYESNALSGENYKYLIVSKL